MFKGTPPAIRARRCACSVKKSASRLNLPILPHSKSLRRGRAIQSLWAEVFWGIFQEAIAAIKLNVAIVSEHYPNARAVG